MSGEWIEWHGGECPVPAYASGRVKLRGGVVSSGSLCGLDWSHNGKSWNILAYKVCDPREHEPSEQSERESVPEVKPTNHPHYHKDVSHLSSIDVYRVLDLFGVTDQAIGHAAKKLLCAGQRGHKDLATDVQNVIDTLERWKEMRKEDANVIATTA